MAGGGVPLHRRAEARVEIGFARGDYAEFEGAAAFLALAHRIILQKFGEPPAVLVRPAVDHDEAVRRRVRARIGSGSPPPSWRVAVPGPHAA